MSEHTEAAAAKGRALLDLGRAKEAEAQFRQALAGEPDDADLHVQLGHALQQQGRFGEAREAAERGLSSRPDHLGALILLSAALAGLKEFAAALQVVRRGLQIAPGLPGLHRQEGALLISQERSEAALESLARARSLDPQDPDTASLVAAALFNVRRWDEAEAVVAEALQLDPNNAEAHRIRGLLSLRRGGGRAAVEAHRRALRQDPTDADYREGLAVSMKTRNPLYGLLLRFGHWQQGLPGGARRLVILAPLIATQLLRPFDHLLWARVLLVLVFTYVLLSWTLEPLMNSVLLLSRYARGLLPRSTKLATSAFLAYIAIAVGCVAVGLAAHSTQALVVALGLGLWSVSAGQTHTVRDRLQRLAVGLQAAGGLLAVATMAAAALGSGSAAPLTGALIITGIGMLWFTSMA